MYNHKNGIVFRKLEETDLSILKELKDESWWGTHKVLVINQQDQQNWFRAIKDTDLYLIGYDCIAQQPLGIGTFNNIDWLNRSLLIGGSLFAKYRGCDNAARCFFAGLDFAFEMLNMRRVEAEVLEINIAAMTLDVKHLGFTVEGRKRKAVYKCGKYYDSIILGILREEWENQDRIKRYNGTCNATITDHEFQERIAKVNALISHEEIRL